MHISIASSKGSDYRKARVPPSFDVYSRFEESCCVRKSAVKVKSTFRVEKEP